MELWMVNKQMKPSQNVFFREIQITIKGDTGAWGKEELDEGSQMVQSSSYKISKYYNVMHIIINPINAAICSIWKLVRE